MNILFCGLIYKSEEEEKLISESKTGLGIASNILQVNTIEGLKKNENNISVLSAKPVGNYPYSNKKVYYKKQSYKINNDIKVEEVSTLNIPLVKDIFRNIAFKKHIKKWYKKYSNKNCEPLTIIIYDLNIALINLIPWIKLNYPDVFIFVFIPDLIGKFRNKTNVSRAIQIINSLRNSNTIEKISLSDGYILITEKMIEQLPYKDFIEVNGMISNDKKSYSIQKHSDDRKVFMYSGYLSEQYNVKEFIDSIIRSDNQNIELWICGYGELEQWIENILDNRIKYFGLLPKKEVEILENKADILVNSRPNNGEYTKYSFPSKNLEYLNSGKPVICYKLDGIPDVFDNIFDYITEEENYDFKIKKYTEMSIEQIDKIGMENRKFVRKYFNNFVQTEKISYFMKEVINKYGEK